MATPSPDQDATARIESDVRYTPYPRSAQAQFAPGTMIAGRYRIAGILGSGGMGEVYRADDTKLDQPVALKFLPARLARDPILLGRLHDEVRLGRQISHPNVCRVYDIVDWEGAQFVAMEFVDGEDLSRLLRRIGRLAHDKAVDIARGIAAGLFAAHAKGILHRDLKPANIMVDSHGEARIMDFGLALAAGEDDGTVSGTPAYMAPEQLEGQQATIQSDLYALGLVMYELFTGKRAHSARTLPERVRDITSEITTPSEVIRDLDPAVERLILRCLSNDPMQRPRSVREVIEALPGGDPLAAALAAGETPSPGMVANASVEGSLSRTAAWSLLGVIAVLFLLYGYIRTERRSTNFMPEPRSPQVLEDRAEELLRELGVAAQGTPVATLRRQTAYLIWVGERVDLLRNGPSPLVHRLMYGVGTDEAGEDYRMTAAPGRTTIELDSRGRLTFLLAAPPQQWKERTLDPNVVLRAAGLDPAAMTPATTRFAPPAPFDQYRAWSGTYPNDSTPVRAELASWHGTPTFFRVTGAWDDAPQGEIPFENRGAALFVNIAGAVVIASGLLLAWRHLRLRRGDRQSAWRLGLVLSLSYFAAAVLTRGLGRDIVQAMDLAGKSLGNALVYGALAYLLYIAIEPVVRRRWPALLISWARLLSGRWRDPMVGRDVLIGVIAGVTHTVCASGSTVVIAQITGKGNVPGTNLQGVEKLSSARLMIASIFNDINGGVAIGFLVMGVLALLTIVFRKRAIGAAGIFGLFLAGYLSATGASPELLLLFIALAAGLAFVVVRYGLLAIAVTQVVFLWIFHLPPLGAAWAAPLTAIPFAVAALVALWAFYISLGGQSPFSAKVLDE